MPDFYEIDFIDVETKCSGDAIAIRYEVSGQRYVHVVDGGYQQTGPSVVNHINTFYGLGTRIDHVVVTHCDGDHTGGLRTVLESMDVGALWMLRPWLYADYLLPRFANYNSADRLRSRLRGIYGSLVALEEIAVRRGIPIYEPYQGQQIGAFRVMAPSQARFLDLVVDSDRTPESVEAAEETTTDRIAAMVAEALRKAATFIASAWGHEIFSPEDTSAENEMSVIQYAILAGHRILLTGDAGRGALEEAANYAPYAGIALPGIDVFQVPHHGSRRNVSTELLDRILGPRLGSQAGQINFSAFISATKEDPDHPRNSVKRAMIHRGGSVFTTESGTVRRHGGPAPDRGWGALTPHAYPDTQEE